MNIGIDVDGVLRNFDGKFEEIHSIKHKDHHLKTNLSSYHMTDRYPGCPNVRQFAFEQYVEDIIGNANIFKGAKDFIDDIKKLGHSVIIVSHQPNEACKAFTLKWLEKHNIYYDKIIFSENKGKEDIEILLDDYTKNLNDVRSNKKMAVAFNREWNQDWDGMRVNTFKQFIDYIS